MPNRSFQSVQRNGGRRSQQAQGNVDDALNEADNDSHRTSRDKHRSPNPSQRENNSQVTHSASSQRKKRRQVRANQDGRSNQQQVSDTPQNLTNTHGYNNQDDDHEDSDSDSDHTSMSNAGNNNVINAGGYQQQPLAQNLAYHQNLQQQQGQQQQPPPNLQQPPPANMQQMAALLQQMQQQQGQQQQIPPPLQQPMPPLNGAVPLQVAGNGGQVMVNGGQVNANGGQVPFRQEVVVRSSRRKKTVKNATLFGNGKITLNESVKALIHNVVRKYVYRRVKFLSSKEQQVIFVADVFKATEMVNFDGGLPEFTTVYGDYCLSELNGQRNYIVDQVKGVVWEYLDTNEGELPDYALMKRFAKREVVWADADEATKRLLVWYAGPLLTRATGVEDWGKPKMCFERISTAHLPGEPNKKHVPASTEAFLLLILEGHGPVWKAQWDFRQTNDKDVEYPNIRFKQGDVIPNEREAFICRYTNPNGGGGKYGGWHESAWDKFLENKAEIATARQGAGVLLLENRIMLALRTKCKITQLTMADWLASKGKRKTANPTLPVERAGMMDEE